MNRKMSPTGDTELRLPIRGIDVCRGKVRRNDSRPELNRIGPALRSALHTCGVLGALVLAVAVFNLACPASGQTGRKVLANEAESELNMVATVHPLATQAGQRMLAEGGNAVDAAIASALTLSVVDGFNSGIGGGCFVLIRTAEGELVAVDGREVAPAAAHRDMYVVDGQPQGQLSKTGALAIGVPGAVRAYHEVAKKYGRLEWSRLVQPAIEAAEQGFVIDANYHSRLQSTANLLAGFPASREVLLDRQGQAWPIDHRLVQSDLAQTLRQLSDDGPEAFYEGAFAAALVQWMADNGGLITADDMKNYKTIQRTPVRTRYRDVEIVGFPPPSSGGVHVAQMLNMLEGHDLAAMWARNPNDVRHLVAETMKLAFADRAYWLGDPGFAKVPRGLLDKSYAQRLSANIDLERAATVESHGQPPAAESELLERHTTHVTAADREGNWIAMTTTVNTTFGSKVIIPGTGVIMNNQMDDFSIAPGVANAYGLVGSEANSVQPGKRPLSSMSPTLVLRDGRPVMTVGAAGGPKIITQVLLAIVRKIDLGYSLADAVGAPRWHHQWSPDRLYVEKGTADDVIAALQAKGHQVVVSSSAGVCQAIAWDAVSKKFVGVHDPRVPGAVGGSDSWQDEKSSGSTPDTTVPSELLLWPAGAPGALGDRPQDKPLLKLSVPEECSGALVVILPGGGYGHLALGHEGTDVARWLNSLGIATAICEYRHQGKGYGHPAPLQDAQRAIQLVRSRAEDWNLNPNQIGVIGFSAGGHLAASVSNHEAIDDAGVSSRPDFAILGYPVILFGHPSGHRGSQRNLIGENAAEELVEYYSMERQVSEKTPRTFLWHTADDAGVKVENSLAYFAALRDAGVPAALHVFPSGRHGLGLAPEHAEVAQWTALCEAWLRACEILPEN